MTTITAAPTLTIGARVDALDWSRDQDGHGVGTVTRGQRTAMGVIFHDSK